MNFFQNLIKGFFRSAVNQVGRDGGKVISNNIYGNKHSTPLRDSKTEDYIDFDYDFSEAETPQKSRGDLLNAGYKAEIFEHTTFENIFSVFGYLIIPFSGTLYWGYIGFKNFFRTKTSFYTYKKKATYKRDRRYKTGARYNGSINVKSYAEKRIPSTKSERIIFLSKGIIAFLIAYTHFAIWYSVFGFDSLKKGDNFEVNQDKKIGIVKYYLIELKRKPIENSKTLDTIYSKDTIRLLNTKKINTDSTKIWFNVKYKNKTGWVWNDYEK